MGLSNKIDTNSLYLDEVLGELYCQVEKSVHGNVKHSYSLRGHKMYNFIDNLERQGGLPAFYRGFPHIHKTIQTIRRVDLDDKTFYYARLWGQIGRAYHAQIKFAKTLT